MKLSHLTISFLILGASMAKAQQNTRPHVAKQDSTKTTKKPVIKSPKKTSKKDSLKSALPKKISPDYCPPCGMG